MLRVKPQITEGGTIRLGALQEVSRVDRTSTTQRGVILSKRALESTVVVDDTQIIVLGGLIEDRLTDGTDKVPLFGDIPVAGALFRYDARARAEDESDDLHQADSGAHELRRPRDHVGALPVSEGEQERQALPNRLFWGDPTPARAAAAGNAARHARAPTGTPPLRRHAMTPPPGAARPRRPAALTSAPALRWPRSRAAPPPDSRAGSRMRSRARTVCWRKARSGGVVVLTRPDATVEGLAKLKRVLQRPLLMRAVDAERFATELARAYNARRAWRRWSEDLARERDLARLMQDLPPAEDLLDSGAQAPVIRMINALLLQALRERASDVHFEPYEARSVVRFRIDGVLRDVLEPPRALHAALVSRVKIMASLDIAEKRLPQDGRLALKLGDKLVDVRVSTLPTGAGERVVLRLLDKDSAQLDLTALGMSRRRSRRWTA